MHQSNSNQYLTELLKQTFIKKINDDWENLWAQKHGKAFIFSKLKSQNAFLDDLLDDIEVKIKKDIGLEKTAAILVSKDSLRRILNQDQSSTLQEKTRNTLAYYVGYDGWKDFEEKNHNAVPSVFQKPVQDNTFNISSSYVLLGILAVGILIIALFLFFISSNKNDEDIKFEIKTISSENFTTSIQILYDLSDLKFKKAQISIENEVLQYIRQPSIINIPEKEGKEGIVRAIFFTPGIKSISLEVDDKVLKTINFVATTNSNWYGCARIKYQEIPDPYEDVYPKVWYGTLNKHEENTTINNLSNPTIWKKYIKLDTQKNAEYPNGYLTFPSSYLHSNENSFSRVAFIKAGLFDLDIDSLSISFKAKRDKIAGEDCMSFMTQLLDENHSRFEYYSSPTCQTSNITFSDTKFPFKSLSEYIFYEFSNNKLNNILEDFQWHKFKIKFVNSVMYIDADGKNLCANKYTYSYKKLREIWFVFEGNGSIDDVEVSNSITKKVLFTDNFDSQ